MKNIEKLALIWRIILAALCAAILIFGFANSGYACVPSEDVCTGEFCLYDSEDISFDEIANRNGRMIVERIKGVVANDSGDGEIIGANPEFCYISYLDVDAEPGDTVITWLVYNPATNYIDDVIARFDFVQR